MSVMTNAKKDSGVSTVVAFIMILAVITAFLGVWVSFGVLSAAAEENEVNTLKAEEFLSDYQMMQTLLRNTEFENPHVCMLAPLGSKHSQVSLVLNGSNAGRLSVVKNGFEEVISCSLNGPVLKIGSHASVGLNAGGIFKDTGRGGAWVVYPKFDIINISGNSLLIKLDDISHTKGDFSLGSTDGAFFNTAYVSCESQKREVTAKGVTDKQNPQNSFEENLTLVYEAYSKENAELFYSSFCNAYFDYLSLGEFNSSKISVEAPKISKNSVEMIFRSRDAPITLSLPEYTYEASPATGGIYRLD